MDNTDDDNNNRNITNIHNTHNDSNINIENSIDDDKNIDTENDENININNDDDNNSKRINNRRNQRRRVRYANDPNTNERNQSRRERYANDPNRNDKNKKRLELIAKDKAERNQERQVRYANDPNRHEKNRSRRVKIASDPNRAEKNRHRRGKEARNPEKAKKIQERRERYANDPNKAENNRRRREKEAEDPQKVTKKQKRREIYANDPDRAEKNRRRREREELKASESRYITTSQAFRKTYFVTLTLSLFSLLLIFWLIQQRQELQQGQQAQELVVGSMHRIQEDDETKQNTVEHSSNRRRDSSNGTKMQPPDNDRRPAYMTPLQQVKQRLQISTRRLREQEISMDALEETHLAEIEEDYELSKRQEQLAAQRFEEANQRTKEANEITKECNRLAIDANRVAKRTEEKRERMLELRQSRQKRIATQSVARAKEEVEEARRAMEEISVAHMNPSHTAVPSPLVDRTVPTAETISEESPLSIEADEIDSEADKIDCETDEVDNEADEIDPGRCLFQSARDDSPDRESPPGRESHTIIHESVEKAKEVPQVTSPVIQKRASVYKHKDWPNRAVRFGRQPGPSPTQDPLSDVQPMGVMGSPAPLWSAQEENLSVVQHIIKYSHEHPSPSFPIPDPGVKFYNPNEPRLFNILEDDLDEHERAQYLDLNNASFTDPKVLDPEEDSEDARNAEDAIGSDGGNDPSNLTSLNEAFACAPQLAELSPKSTLMSMKTKINLTKGIRWIKYDTQESVKDTVRHLFEIKLWGPNEELLHDVTLFVLCQKLGVTCTGGKKRADMLSRLREFRDPDQLVSMERNWQLPGKYKNYFGIPL